MDKGRRGGENSSMSCAVKEERWMTTKKEMRKFQTTQQIQRLEKTRKMKGEEDENQLQI
jgi:hypothetical protein